MQGQLKLEVLRATDRVRVACKEVHNLFLTQGYEELAHILGGDDVNDRRISQMQFGTGASLPTAEDTLLQMPITPIKSVSATFPPADPYAVLIEAFLLADEANGFPISEAGLLSSEDTLMARAVFSQQSKTSDYIFHFSWRISD